MDPSLPQLLARKRDGGRLDDAAIDALVQAIASRRIDPCQIGAFAMAVRLRGMDVTETVALTRAMAASGQVLRWPAGAPLLDKHSTGGVGDCTSLIVAPVLAACGARVPMLSGRGLGHTGGTLDKLEAIPGYRCLPSLAQLRRVVGEAGCAIVGAGPRLAPADRSLYAVRDVTATVDSIPLITASILSKKLAAGIDTLVLDVKLGNGAILAEPAQARALAHSLQQVAQAAGLRIRVLLSDMQQPLASAAGNALELQVVFDVLLGRDRDSRLRRLSLQLAAEGLLAGGLQTDPAGALQSAQQALDSGAAAERFARMVHGLGGPVDLLEHPQRYLAVAPCRLPVPAPRAGHLAGWDTRALGERVVELGGGRRRAGDAIDARVGLNDILPVGSELSAGQPLAWVHAADAQAARAAVQALLSAVRITEQAVAPPSLLHRIEDC